MELFLREGLDRPNQLEAIEKISMQDGLSMVTRIRGYSFVGHDEWKLLRIPMTSSFAGNSYDYGKRSTLIARRAMIKVDLKSGVRVAFR
jgi:hypothetical protein